MNKLIFAFSGIGIGSAGVLTYICSVHDSFNGRNGVSLPWMDTDTFVGYRRVAGNVYHFRFIRNATGSKTIKLYSWLFGDTWHKSSSITYPSKVMRERLLLGSDKFKTYYEKNSD